MRRLLPVLGLADKLVDYITDVGVLVAAAGVIFPWKAEAGRGLSFYQPANIHPPLTPPQGRGMFAANRLLPLEGGGWVGVETRLPGATSTVSQPLPQGSGIPPYQR